LARLHDVEIDIEPDAERAYDLANHLTVLASRDNPNRKTAIGREHSYHRRKLDGFRSRAEDHRDTQLPGRIDRFLI